MIQRYLYILLISIVLLSCKSTKTGVASANVKKLSSKEVIKKHYNNDVGFKTLKSTLKINYVDEERDDLITADLRMEKDKKIWISAKLLFVPLAKVLITPEKVSYYNKIDKEYFEGDFSLISEWLGVDLNFEQVQNLLLAQSVFDLNNGKYDVHNEPDNYLLSPKSQPDLFEFFLRIHPENFKISSQEIAQPKELRVLNVEYSNYQDIIRQTFPKNINIVAVEKTQETKIDIEYRNVSLNQDLRFPFRIPGHYKEITFEP